MTKFAQFALKSNPSEIRVGVLGPDGLADVTAKYSSLDAIIKNGQLGEVDTSDAVQVGLGDIEFRAPVYQPEKIVCIGKNYLDHAKEVGEGVPTEPVIFNKLPSCITHHGAPILNPKVGGNVDWEGELAVIIGKECRHVKAENAMDYVAGFTVANDVTARDWQKKRNMGQWFIGKSFDTFCPLGPIFTTKDEIEDVQNLKIETIVNGKVEQSSNTKNMIFTIPVMIEWMSQFWTFKAGDVILTGTPDGVGAFRNPPVFLKDGDVVKVQIEKLGSLENPVVDEV